MPRPGPRRPGLTVRVDPHQREWLRAEAKKRGASEGSLIRQMIDREMTAGEKE